MRAAGSRQLQGEEAADTPGADFGVDHRAGCKSSIRAAADGPEGTLLSGFWFFREARGPGCNSVQELQPVFLDSERLLDSVSSQSAPVFLPR